MADPNELSRAQIETRLAKLDEQAEEIKRERSELRKALDEHIELDRLAAHIGINPAALSKLSESERRALLKVRELVGRDDLRVEINAAGAATTSKEVSVSNE